MKKRPMRMAGWFLKIIAMTAGVFLYPSCAEAKGKNDAEMEPDPKEKFHIYLAFGQSNMVGYLGPPVGTWGSSSSQAWVASNGFDRPPENFVVMAAANDNEGLRPSMSSLAQSCPCKHGRDFAPFVNKNPYNRKKGEWYEAKPPLVRNNTGLSPADFFGRTIAETVKGQGIKIGVIVIAVDGCQINLFSKDKDVFINYIKTQEDWMRNQAVSYVDPGVGSTIPAADFTTGDYPYKRLVDLAKLAQREGVIKGIIMHQGESGGNLTGKTYAQTVRQIYDDLCDDLGLEKGKVPFLTGQAVGNNNPNIASIPIAFKDIPNTAFVIPSDGCPGWNPGSSDSNERIHFSFAAYEELGKRYGRKMLELVY